MPSMLLTGANRGIGLALCQNYLKQGWQVHATFRDTRHSQELLAMMEEYKQLHCHQLDVTDYARVAALAETLPPIDLLINNAGYYGPKGYGFGNTDVDEWRKVLEINTIAPLKLVETLYPLLKQGQLKTIACLSSRVGSMAENTSGGGYIYRSSKAALNSVVKSLSNDLSVEGFVAVALHPGWVKTEMGGPNAILEIPKSAAGLVKVIGNLTPEDSGRFLNYDGTEIPW